MHAGYVRISADLTVEEAIAEIRQQAGQVEMIYYAYVLDDAQHLMGVISFRELISADRSRKVREVMRTDYVFVLEDADQETVAQLLAKKRLLAVPVLDQDGSMLGIVTSADVAGIVQQEAGEDIVKIGGTEALDGPYLEVTFAQMVRKRAGWLAILFVGEMLTATAMGFFSAEIERAVVLALFIPLIISSGGNSGSQATTLVIRAMALGEIRLRDWWRVIRRELAAGVVLGGVLGVIGVTRIFVWHAVRDIWAALRDRRSHHWVQLDRGSHVRYNRRLDAAIHLASMRARSRQRIRAICCHPGGRHWLGYLLLGSECHPSWSLAVDLHPLRLRVPSALSINQVRQLSGSASTCTARSSKVASLFWWR